MEDYKSIEKENSRITKYFIVSNNPDQYKNFLNHNTRLPRINAEYSDSLYKNDRLYMKKLEERGFNIQVINIKKSKSYG